jgi:superfamily I DNA and/or RNA helicase
MIDEDILKSFKEDESGLSRLEEDEYRESAFGYLKKRLEELYDKDGFVRTVTLDAQYRMHPMLGSFVSKHFYDNYGEGFESPLDGTYFVHNLPGTQGKPAAWLDVPRERGAHDVNGTSWYRKAEADAIAKQFQIWKTCEEGKKLSYGIISFYKEQADRIGATLTRLGVDEELWPRIGTVDAFQGMEFDVVFLSMVWAYTTEELNAFMRDKNKGRRNFNAFRFLVSKNRLCVSLSRQKKLLVIAGDKNTAKSALCKQALPSVYEFLETCEEGGGALL